jgi:hypothetical protein
MLQNRNEGIVILKIDNSAFFSKKIQKIGTAIHIIKKEIKAIYLVIFL